MLRIIKMECKSWGLNEDEFDKVSKVQSETKLKSELREFCETEMGFIKLNKKREEVFKRRKKIWKI